jgi:N-acetylglucosamine kinase-like BadF-type ATPase
MDYILGVDGGATKTTARISDHTGKTITEIESGSSNYKGAGIENSKININLAVIGAIKEIPSSDKIIFKSACFGMAGNDSLEDKKIYRKIIFNDKIKNYLISSNTIICNDTKIGLAAGSSSKNGIMIICGTGSNCFGINEYGQEAIANGWDYILGDEGSGYAIGQKALKALMKAYDGRGGKTLLSKTIFEDLNINSIAELVSWTYSKSVLKDDISAIAKTVCRTAEMGDNISVKILEEEVEEAFISIVTVANKLKLAEQYFDLVFVGNVFKCKKYFKDILIKKLDDRFPGINFKPLTEKPVEGAIKLAIGKL